MRVGWMIAGILTLGGAAFAARAAFAGRYEAPAHTVRADHGDWQVRDYSPTIEARVTVDGAFEDATGDAFRLLAGYIFGGNGGDQKIAMTVPVSAAPVDVEPGAPRVTRDGGAGQWVVAFTMPSEYRIDELPTPRDGRVRLVEVPGGAWAVRPFSGWMKAARADAHIASLRADLAAAGLTEVGAPVIAQYDPPWTPGFLRHNEILIPIEP